MTLPFTFIPFGMETPVKVVSALLEKVDARGASDRRLDRKVTELAAKSSRQSCFILGLILSNILRPWTKRRSTFLLLCCDSLYFCGVVMKIQNFTQKGLSSGTKTLQNSLGSAEYFWVFFFFFEKSAFQNVSVTCNEQDYSSVVCPAQLIIPLRFVQQFLVLSSPLCRDANLAMTTVYSPNWSCSTARTSLSPSPVSCTCSDDFGTIF